MCMWSYFPFFTLLPLLLESSFLSSPPTDPFSVWWFVVELGWWWIIGDARTFSPLLSSTSLPLFPYPIIANPTSHSLYFPMYILSQILFIVFYLPSNVGYCRYISPHQCPFPFVLSIIIPSDYRTIVMMGLCSNHTHSYVIYLSYTLDLGKTYYFVQLIHYSPYFWVVGNVECTYPPILSPYIYLSPQHYFSCWCLVGRMGVATQSTPPSSLPTSIHSIMLPFFLLIPAQIWWY